jgi:hypothetical protein
MDTPEHAGNVPQFKFDAILGVPAAHLLNPIILGFTYTRTRTMSIQQTQPSLIINRLAITLRAYSSYEHARPWTKLLDA